MRVDLLPRLEALEAERLVALHPASPLRNLGLAIEGTFPEKVSFGSSGGHPVAIDRLRELQTSVIELAKDCGYPGKSLSAQRAKFDEAGAILLASLSWIQAGEGLRDDVWTFLSTLLLPEVVLWRFGNSSERFLGGVRNTLQRLWIRGTLFDRGEGSANRWHLLRSLTEDAMVQITERPAIAGEKRLALATAEAWDRACGRYPKGSMEGIMRKAIIGVRLRNELIMFSHLADERLSAALDREFDRAALALGNQVVHA